MSLQKLKSLGTYDDINAGAHRKPASVVGIPSLVRNLGFWNTGFKVPKRDPVEAGHDPAAGQEKSEGQSAAERSKAYEKYVRRLKAHIKSDKSGSLEPVASKDPPARNTPGESGTVTLISFLWHGIWGTVRLEFHSEYITLASILDLSIEPSATAAAPGGKDPFFEKIRSRIERLGKLFDQPERTDEYGSISSFLQKTVWDEFESEVIDFKIRDKAILGCKFGEVFLDSRGIVIGAGKVERRTADGRRADKTLYRELQKPFRYPRPRKRTDTAIAHTSPKPKWASETLHRIWPFVESEGQAGYEFTVSGFLRGQVLFITALGPQPAPSEGSPILYFLHAYADDEWQLGRLVDRINSLGTLRLAATMEIGHLRAAGAKMDELARAIEEAARSVQSEIKRVKARSDGGYGTAETADAPAATAPVGGIDEIDISAVGAGQGESEEIEGGRRDGELGATETLDTPGTIALVGELHKQINKSATKDIWDRLERSQYYLKQFRKDCGALREQRVEGFQTYSEFVTRRMSSIFGYIQFLRTRMEGLDVANSSLERQYSWLKITDVTGEIRQVVGKMNKQNKAIKSQGREIGKIQEFGEVILIGALLPYYIGSMLAHIWGIEGAAAAPIFFTCAVLSSLAVITRILFKWSDRKAWNRLRWMLPLFLVYLLFAGIVFARLRHPSPSAGSEAAPAVVAPALPGRPGHR